MSNAGLASYPQHLGDTSQEQKVISRTKFPLYGNRTWKIEASHCLTSFHLSYEEDLAVAYELNEMMMGNFHKVELLRRSKNKLQLLLECQCHLGVRIMYMIGIKRTASVVNGEVRQYGYEPYVRLVKLTTNRESKKSGGLNFIQRVSQIWKGEEYAFEPEELWPSTNTDTELGLAQKEAEYIFYEGALKDKDVAAYLNNTRLAPMRYYSHEPLRKDRLYYYNQETKSWDSKKR